MDKITQGLKYYSYSIGSPKGYQYRMCQIKPEQVGTIISGGQYIQLGWTTETWDRFYEAITDYDEVSLPGIEVLFEEEDVESEEFGSQKVVYRIVRHINTGRSYLVFIALGVTLDEYGWVDKVEEVYDESVYYINDDQYLDASIRSQKLSREVDHKLNVKADEEDRQNKQYEAELAIKEQQYKEEYQKRLEGSFSNLSGGEQQSIRVLREATKGLSKSSPQQLGVIQRKLPFIEDIVYEGETVDWLMLKIRHPKGYLGNKTRTSSQLSVYKGGLKVRILRGRHKDPAVAHTYHLVIGWLGTSGITLMSPKEIQAGWDAEYERKRKELFNSLRQFM